MTRRGKSHSGKKSPARPIYDCEIQRRARLGAPSSPLAKPHPPRPPLRFSPLAERGRRARQRFGAFGRLGCMRWRDWALIGKPLSRHMRTHATRAEAVLWAHLRGRRLEGMRFRRQHAIGRYILDFDVQSDASSSRSMERRTSNATPTTRPGTAISGRLVCGFCAWPMSRSSWTSKIRSSSLLSLSASGEGAGGVRFWREGAGG